MSDFKKIPYVGEAIEADLLALGYEDIASLNGADPDEMFERTKALGRGSEIKFSELCSARMKFKISFPRARNFN